MIPLIAGTVFMVLLLGYLSLMKAQGDLEAGERLLHAERKIRCALRSPGARLFATRHVLVTDRRIVEKELGLCVRTCTLPGMTGRHLVLNVLRADSMNVAADEDGQGCLELACRSGNRSRHFVMRYYFRDPVAVHDVVSATLS